MKSVFVSSTFRDMHFERDILNRTLAPKLNFQLSKYNQSVRILDLRWGVDTSGLSEKEASERVLKVCADEIDRCMPYMVVLLGDRYGYIPNDEDISVTHMEILRGALQNTDKDHIFIYFRNADYSALPKELYGVYCEQDAKAKDKLLKLKTLLKQEMPMRCREYNSYWDEEKQLLVSDDFEALVTKDLEEDLLNTASAVKYQSELHKQLQENEETLNDNINYSYCNTKKLNSLISSIETNTKPHCIIGEAGAGKSVYMSLLCSALRKNGKNANILFCGDNSFSASVRNAAEFMLCSLTEACGLKYNFEKFSLLSYEELLAHITQLRDEIKTDIFVLFDAVDKCDNGMVQFILWCSRFIADKIHIVFSSQMLEVISEQKESFIITDMEYDRADFTNMIGCLLKKYGKNLNSELIDLICEKTTTPLHLNIMLLRLLNLSSEDFEEIQKNGGNIEAINTYLRNTIEKHSSDTDEITLDYMQVLLNQSQNPKFDVVLLCFLIYCTQGLHETDLQALCNYTYCEWVQIDFIDFLARFSFFIRSRDNGRLDISHDALRKTMMGALSDDKKPICMAICDYFSKIENPDDVAISSFFDTAYIGKINSGIVSYVLKYKDTYASFEKDKLSIGVKIKKCIKKIFLQDGGEFTFSCFAMCKSPDELLYFQSVLSSALLSSNDYLDEKTALTLLQGSMIIPVKLIEFPSDLAKMELLSCQNFVRRQNLKTKEVDEFFEYCNKMIAKKEQKEAETQQQPQKESFKSDDPIEQMLHILFDEDSEIIKKGTAFEQLSKLGRSYAGQTQTAETAEKILLKLIDALNLNFLQSEDDIRDISYADVYTSFGVLYKTTKQWEKGIDYDTKSLEIYRRLYEKCPTDDFFRKYRERLYNIANIIEAQAMTVKDDLDLWQKTKDAYAKVYENDMLAIAKGIPDRELLLCSGSIFSYGTALINSGLHDEGIQKYKEGLKLAEELAKNNPVCDVYTELYKTYLECISQLSACGKMDIAETLCGDLYRTIEIVIKNGTDKQIEELKFFIRCFLNNINDIISGLFKTQELEKSIVVSNILYNVYCAVLPVSDFAIKSNIILTKRNIGDIWYLKLNNYQKAYEEYKQLLDLLNKTELLEKDDNGQYQDNINVRLIDVYYRALICLEKTGQREKAQEMLNDAHEWSQFLAEHTEVAKGDAPKILYVMGTALLKEQSPAGLAMLLIAYNATNQEGYDKVKHSDTVLMILKTLSEISGNDDKKTE